MKFKLFIRSLFLETLINMKNMQNFGFAYLIEPVLKLVCKNKRDYRYHLAKNFEYFNTNPYFAMFITGAANKFAETGKLNELSKFKSTVTAPFAGLGDALTWGTMQPFFAFITASFILLNYYWAPIFFIVGYNLMTTHIRISGLQMGYREGSNIVYSIVKLHCKYIIVILKYILLVYWPGVLMLWLNYAGLLDRNRLLKFLFYLGFIMFFYFLNKRLKVVFTYIIFCVLSFLYYSITL